MSKKERWHLFFDEKDWGADQIALSLSEKLDLGGFHRVHIARALFDFGRFPGSTPHDKRNHMSRHAINEPFTEDLTHEEKRILLEKYYDYISGYYEKIVPECNLKIGIHTYDQYNPYKSKYDRPTERPLISLLYRSLTFQMQTRMPFGVFDKMFPDELAEFTADTKLIARISLTFERAGIPVAHNYPYLLPEGGLEVRSHVWTFFRFLKQYYERSYQDSANDDAHRSVWDMLLDTNLRSGNAELYRSYIHMYHLPLMDLPLMNYGPKCVAAEKVYSTIWSFLQANKAEIITEYRKDRCHYSALAIEIRKDYVWDLEKMTPRQDRILSIASLLAQAVREYFERDRSGEVILTSRA